MTESNTPISKVWKKEEHCKLKIDLFYIFNVTISIVEGVSRVIEFSSQYNDSTWSANQVIGPPKVYPRHGKYFQNIFQVVLLH